MYYIQILISASVTDMNVQLCISNDLLALVTTNEINP